MKIRVDEVQIGQTVRANLAGGFHKVARIVTGGANMRSATATTLSFYNEDGEEFFIGRVYAKATIQA